jgi:hypothetical protein
MRSKSIAVFVALVAVTSVAAQDELPILSGQLVSQFDDRVHSRQRPASSSVI